MAVGEETGDESLLLQARHAQWSYRGLIGDFVNSLDFAKVGWKTYDRHHHHAQAYEFGWHDPACCAKNYIGWCNANLGFPDRAAQHIAENIVFVATLNHPMSMAFCHAFAAMSLVVMRQFGEAEHHAASAMAIANEFDLKALGAMSSVFNSR